MSILNLLETKRLKIKKQILVAHTFISLKEIDSKINSIKSKSIKINSIKLKLIKLFRTIEIVITKFYDYANEIDVKLNFIATSALFVLNVDCIVNFKNIVLQKSVDFATNFKDRLLTILKLEHKIRDNVELIN